MENKTVELSRGAVNVLSHLLAQAGWYEGKLDVAYLAGKILTEVLPDSSADEQFAQEAAQRSPERDRKRLKQYLDEPFKFELTERQWGVVRKCIEFFIKGSKMPISSHTLQLFDVFDLAPVKEG